MGLATSPTSCTVVLPNQHPRSTVDYVGVAWNAVPSFAATAVALIAVFSSQAAASARRHFRCAHPLVRPLHRPRVRLVCLTATRRDRIRDDSPRRRWGRRCLSRTPCLNDAGKNGHKHRAARNGIARTAGPGPERARLQDCLRTGAHVFTLLSRGNWRLRPYQQEVDRCTTS